jgi:hypothetical protein
MPAPGNRQRLRQLEHSFAREIEQAYPMALLTATLKAPERQGELDFDDIDLLGRTGREAGLKWFATGSLEGGRYEEGKEGTPFDGQVEHARRFAQDRGET